jgi:Type I phosphodiesterase / nucleotide pyrophosphatase
VKFSPAPFFVFLTFLLISGLESAATPLFERIVIIKIDGLNQDLLYRTMLQQDPESGKSRLPWITHIFLSENGVVFHNFYVRGISLSAPSWSMLDSGRHSVIRGNVEYDRFTGAVYDYLNFFPFYLGYARNRAVDMPGVEVLDRAGIPLIIDRFHHEEVLQGFQLFQRGVVWTTLRDSLLRSFSGKAIFSMLESAQPISLSSSLSEQLESILERGLTGKQLLYLDFFTGDADHEGHATSNPSALEHVLSELDALLGRVWTAIQQGPLARQTLLVLVSDHGMNNTPGVLSQTFSIPDLLNSPAGGAHHVVTDREQLSDYKLKGINPLVHRVITPSSRSFYLKDQASHYPTAWLDIDGNERAAICLRNSDLNKIHILLQQLSKRNLDASIRRAAAQCLQETVDRHRERWKKTIAELDGEMAALNQVIAERKKILARSREKSKQEERESGADKARRRLRRELQQWQSEQSGYQGYLAHLKALLVFEPDKSRPFNGAISNLIPEMALGDNNTVYDLENYIVGPSAGGLVLDQQGRLDEQRSFRCVDYFRLFAAQRARNNPQSQLSSEPIDFTEMAVPGAYWLYADDERQLLILQDTAGRSRLQPIRNLVQDATGNTRWEENSWRDGLPLRLFEDPALQLPPGQDRASWLSSWHTEREWLSATHLCRYSNGVIGAVEDCSPVGPYVPGSPGLSPVLLSYEQRRRELVQADFQVFASDHWNFNVRFPNPGGNHGSFLRISTHSVWMMAGAGLPGKQIEDPYDSLNFASTILNLMGRTPPMPDRVVPLP